MVDPNRTAAVSAFETSRASKCKHFDSLRSIKLNPFSCYAHACARMRPMRERRDKETPLG